MDEFELNDDDFDFGDTPSPNKKLNIKNFNKVENFSPKVPLKEENNTEELQWMDSFVMESQPEKMQKTFYQDNAGSDKQIIKRQKTKIHQLEKELFDIKKSPAKVQKS